MAQRRNVVVILDRENSPTRPLIESLFQVPCSLYSSFSSILDSQNAEDFLFCIVDVEAVSHEMLSENVLRVKEKFPILPLIALTENKSLEFVLQLLSWGFDEFLLKPFQKDDLFIRIEVKKETLSRDKEKSVTVGNITVDPQARVIKNLANGKSSFLSPIEVNLLCALLSHMNQAISREDVKKKCWNGENVSDNALNRKLFEVRKALSKIDSELTIKTIYGSGYALQKIKGSKKESTEPSS